MYAGEHEKELLADAYKNLSAHMGAKITLEADVWIKDKQHINPAGIDIEVIHTPGHTSGGVSYYVKDALCFFQVILCLLNSWKDRFCNGKFFRYCFKHKR